MDNKTILVVDDFENTRWVIAFTLKQIKCEVLQAKNGKEALRYFDGRDIDLLITDLNMPEMDGISLVKEVRDIPKYSFIPILMLTTEKSLERRKEAEKAKVTAWIKKPFETAYFLKIINKSLNQSIR